MKVLVSILSLSLLGLSAVAGCATNAEETQDQGGQLGSRGTEANASAGNAPEDGSLADAAVDGSSANGLQATINGKAFEPISAAAFSMDGALNLTFSDEADSCEMVKSVGFSAGTTYIQIFGLGTEPGTYELDDAKIVTVESICPSGEYPSVSYYTEAVKGATVTLTSVGSVVEGTVSATFGDGSTVTGSFSLPTCSEVGTGAPTCR